MRSLGCHLANKTFLTPNLKALRKLRFWVDIKTDKLGFDNFHLHLRRNWLSSGSLSHRLQIHKMGSMKIKELLHSIYSDNFRHTHLENSAKSVRFNISMTKMKEKKNDNTRMTITRQQISESPN